MPVRFRPRPAFTLVELLVVIAIIGVLVGLLLPAVQAAREAARRASCQNNMKNIALAAINFSTTAQKFPKNATRPDPSGNQTPNGISWMTAILPHLEQNVLYDQIDFRQDSGAPVYGQMQYLTGPLSVPANLAVVGTRIPVYQCPSDGTSYESQTKRGEASWFPADIAMGGTSYKGVMGSLWLWYDMASPPLDGTFTAKKNSFDQTVNPAISGSTVSANGKQISVWAFSANNGIFYPGLMVGTANVTPDRTDCSTRLADIKDGQSNVFMVGESISDYSNRTAWGHPYFATGTTLTPLNDKAKCQSTGNRTRDLQACAAIWGDNSGFYSSHTGGGQFAMADGAVRWVSDQIDILTYQRLGAMADGNVANIEAD